MKRLRCSILAGILILGMIFSQSGMVFAADDGPMDVLIEGDLVVLDTFNGVDALYRTGLSDGSNTTYSCAAYIKKYYQAIYGVTPYNLFHMQTPLVAGDTFVRVATPQVGDISTDVKTSSNHWSIVKEVREDSVVVIEQNYKWRSGNEYYARVNRVIKKSDVEFFRLASINTDPVVDVPVVPVVPDVIPNDPNDLTGGNNNQAKPEVPVDNEPIIEKASLILSVGKSKTLNKEHFDTLADKPKVVWSSDNKKVATVSKTGKVKALKKGITKIVGKTDNGTTMECTVNVGNLATSLTLSKEDVTIKVEESFTLLGIMNPTKNADSLTFTSDNKDIAVVTKEGVATGVKPGKTLIKVKTKGNLTAECIVRVK